MDTTQSVINYPIRFPADLYEELGELAMAANRTRADVIRTLVKEAHKEIKSVRPLISSKQVVAALGLEHAPS